MCLAKRSGERWGRRRWLLLEQWVEHMFKRANDLVTAFISELD